VIARDRLVFPQVWANGGQNGTDVLRHHIPRHHMTAHLGPAGRSRLRRSGGRLNYRFLAYFGRVSLDGGKQRAFLLLDGIAVDNAFGDHLTRCCCHRSSCPRIYNLGVVRAALNKRTPGRFTEQLSERAPTLTNEISADRVNQIPDRPASHPRRRPPLSENPRHRTHSDSPQLSRRDDQHKESVRKSRDRSLPIGRHQPARVNRPRHACAFI